MANNNGNGKKNDVTANQGAQPEVVQPAKRSDNLFDRVGNQQIHQAIATAQAEQKAPETLLTSMVENETQNETQAGVEQQSSQDWWKDDAQAQAQVEEEETSIAQKLEPEAEVQKAPEPSKVAETPGAAAVLAAVTPQVAPEVAPEVAAVEKKDVVAQKLDSEAGQDQKIQAQAAEKLLMARAMLRGEDASQVSVEKESEQEISQQEELALAELESKEASGTATEAVAMLIMADAQNMDDLDKAEMLTHGREEVQESDLEGQSGELRALMAAEQLPNQLGDFDRDAANIVSDTPMNERQTLRNLTDEIRMIAERIHNHPKMLDPNATIEEKSTALVETLARQLDVPTRESIAAHPFTALTEDLVFEPRAMMEINKISGSQRDIRQMGSFAVILWQLTTNAARGELDTIGDAKLINENDFLSGMLTNMANKMYVDALAQPGW